MLLNKVEHIGSLLKLSSGEGILVTLGPAGVAYLIDKARENHDRWIHLRLQGTEEEVYVKAHDVIAIVRWAYKV